MSYATTEDVYLVFGKANVKKWADLDNTNVTETITDRIEWAIDLASAYVDSRLVGGRYEIPFETPYPTMIVHITAMQAGVMLYDGRQVVGAVDKDQVTRQRLDIDKYLRQIFRGQMRLVNPTTNERLELTAYNAPSIVRDETDTDREEDSCS